MANLTRLLEKIEQCRLLKKERDVLYDKQSKIEGEIIQELKDENLIYVNYHFQNFTNELEHLFNYYDALYSSKISDFLLPNLFEKCVKERLYFDICCISPKFKTVVVFVNYEKRPGVLLFADCNELSEKEYSKLIVHPDKEKLLEFLLADRASGDIAKEILSWA